jgi:hypothetical protein
MKRRKPSRREGMNFISDETGLEVVEWFLLIGGGILPLFALIMKIMLMLAEYYSFASWVTSLPFP